MPSQPKTLARMRRRVTQLSDGFTDYLDLFDEAKLFTGPSLYFHFKAIEIRQRHGTALQTLGDDDFFDSLYATLTAWGMHRMGPGNTKLIEIDKIKSSFCAQRDRIRRLEDLTITSIERQNVAGLTKDLWDVISRLKVGIARAQIVANSKALHHLLPSLVPPIDREYTLRFFYNRKMLTVSERVAFQELYPQFHRIAIGNAQEIQKRIGSGMNTSETKVIDNAIVGYVLKHLKEK